MKIKTILTALIISGNFTVAHAFETSTANGGSSTLHKVDAKAFLSATDELRDLQRRQADLLANSNALSSLRVQYAHVQLWYLYNDTIFIYLLES